MNKIGTQRVQNNGVRTRIQNYQLGWPSQAGVADIPADAWQAVV